MKTGETTRCAPAQAGLRSAKQDLRPTSLAGACPSSWVFRFGVLEARSTDCPRGRASSRSCARTLQGSDIAERQLSDIAQRHAGDASELKAEADEIGAELVTQEGAKEA
jgi:hypothetical protein